MEEYWIFNEAYCSYSYSSSSRGVFSAIHLTAVVSFLFGRPTAARRPKGPKIKPLINQRKPLYPFSSATVEVNSPLTKKAKGTKTLKAVSKILKVASSDIAGEITSLGGLNLFS